MRVRLKLTEHWFKLKVIATHEPRFLKFKLQLLVLVHVIEDDETVADLAALKFSKINALI